MTESLNEIVDRDYRGRSKESRSIVQQEARTPDFVIAGAMKAGTTTLHYLLNAHPRIYIPSQEIFFFDLDDLEQHPDFSVGSDGTWVHHDWERDFDLYFHWYSSFFRGASRGQIVGEDSTTYLASRVVPARMAKLLPNLKILIMLRDPVRRAYSNYWHLVRTGRVSRDFETQLRLFPGTILQRGFYKEQVSRFLECFPRSQLHVVIFEKFLRHPQSSLDTILRFLGADTGIVDVDKTGWHRNRGSAPYFLSLKRFQNWLGGKPAAERYSGYLPTSFVEVADSGSADGREKAPFTERIRGKLRRLLPRRSYPPMDNGIRKYLERLYSNQNRGLDELLELDLKSFWPYM